MAIIGSSLGLVTALLLHALMGRLRRRQPAPVSVFGWLSTGGIVVYGAGCLEAYRVARNDPAASISPPWGFYTLGVGLLLLIGVGFGLIHSRRDSVLWGRAFGGVMADAGAAIGVGLLLYTSVVPMAALIRTGSMSGLLDSGTENLLMAMLGTFALSLLVSLFLLLAFPGRRAGSGHQPTPSSA